MGERSKNQSSVPDELLTVIRRNRIANISSREATLQIIWCFFCHASRNEPVFAAKAAACRGFDVSKTSIAYYALNRLHSKGFAVRKAERPGVSAGPQKQFYEPPPGPRGAFISELAARTQMPEDCPVYEQTAEKQISTLDS
jgi:hypothetical protein